MASRNPIVSVTDVAAFPKPSGTKLSTSRCPTPSFPKPCKPEGPSKEKCPVLLHDDYIYWPFSYNDNRLSFAIVRTSSTSKEPIDMLEVKGARYIDSIEVSPANDSVSFIGQDYKAVSVPWNNLPSFAVLSPSFSRASSSTNSELEDDLEVGAIVGIVVGSVLGAMFIVVISSYLYWRKLRRKGKIISHLGLRTASAGNIENGEPDLGDRESLFGRNRRGSSRTMESRPTAIFSTSDRSDYCSDYGTIYPSNTSGPRPTTARADTWNSIDGHPPGFGLGDPGSDYAAP